MIARFSGILNLSGIPFHTYQTSAGYFIAMDDMWKTLDFDNADGLSFVRYLSSVISVSSEVIEAIENPIRVEYRNATDRAITIKHFRQVMELFTRAKDEGFLYASEINKGKVAERLLEYELDRIHLLAECATGYRVYKDNIKNLFKTRLTEESNHPVFQWIIAFPDNFIESLLHLLGKTWKSAEETPEECASFLTEVVFSRLPDETLETLLISKPRKKYGKNGLLTRYLPTEDLSRFFDGINGLIQIADGSKEIFFQLLNRYAPVKHTYLRLQLTKKKQQIPEDLLPIYDIIKQTFD